MINLAAEKAPVGIGPVISGEWRGRPSYYWDTVFYDGTTERHAVQKRRTGGDRSAKLQAINDRMRTATALRPAGVVLIHDLPSFQGLVALLCRIGRSSATPLQRAA